MNARWMVATAVGILAFATWALLPDAFMELERARRPLVVTPARDAQGEAKRDAMDTAARIMALRQVDRWVRRAVAGHAGGRALDLVSTESRVDEVDPSGDRGADAQDRADQTMRAAQSERADARARGTLRAWGLDAPQVAVGVYLPADDGYGWPDEVHRPDGFGGLRMVVDGRTVGGQPYCVQIGRLPTKDDAVHIEGTPLNDDGTGPGSFGACWLHARYGEPGTAVGEWMRRTGMAAALVSRAPTYSPWDAVDDPRERRVYDALGLRATTLLFGSIEPGLADHCIAGKEEACRAAFGALAKDESWVGSGSYRRLREVVPDAFYPFAVHSRYLPDNWLYALEAQYGPERMAAFWTSDQDVVTAFETAFGVDLETTMMELGRARFGAEPTGPRLAGWGWLGLLGSIAAGLATSAHLMRRRTIA